MLLGLLGAQMLAHLEVAESTRFPVDCIARLFVLLRTFHGNALASVPGPAFSVILSGEGGCIELVRALGGMPPVPLLPRCNQGAILISLRNCWDAKPLGPESAGGHKLSCPHRRAAQASFR